ncbi:integration host factor, actinobacterial type [Corynebacterium glyciniphilum]|uniref:integration host factor, actinobacterial type n=1 Tax=Corynebacterium glyciniphilum TaxID=1404244 RepID=UPI00264D9740|nr:integration host factor, actinobacterial type [Corynebacterium glyciniphilum]MDN6707415.1 integration host factor [Corynebacterium glyciniphilum]
MSLPPLTGEQRAEALAKASAARTARADLRHSLRMGTTSIADVLDSDDPVVLKTRVVQVLTALPKIGKAKAEDIMTELEIAPTRKVGGLGPRQRDALLERFGYTD